MKRLLLLRPLVLAGLILSLAACKKPAEPTAPVAEPVPAQPPATDATPSAPGGYSPPVKATTAPKTTAAAKPTATGPVPAELWKEFSGEKAMEEVKKQVDLGPRPAGSAEDAAARDLIKAGMKRAGWTVEEQAFDDETPRGTVHFVNLVCRFGATPASAPHAIICSHFDTKRFSTIRFVGASDGASSTGALIELGRVLALDPAMAARCELVFFDGEEAVQQFTETDGLYGSRFYARSLAEGNRAAQFKFAILWDMIGDANLTITLPSDSPPELANGILVSADALNVRSNFSFFRSQLLDDHVPLARRHIPSIDLIDFDYPPWHTADDTLDKLSPNSLQTVGQVTLHYLKRTLTH